MRKHSLIACLAIVGMCSSAFAALPAEASKRLNKAALAPEAPASSLDLQAAGPCGVPCTNFFDFDDAADFVAGTWIGNGLNGAAGGVFSTWSATCTSNPANWPGGIVGTPAEGHVETANPFSGTQHVRLSKDPNMLTSGFGCVMDARYPASAAVVPSVVSPQTVSMQLAINGQFSANFQVQPQQPTAGFRTTTILFFYYGTRYVIDNLGGATFTFAGFWDTTGGYDNYTMHIDPCAKYTCDGGTNESLACNGALDCPGGVCAGFINYGDNGGVFYQGQAWAGQNFEQLLFYSDNTGGGNPTGMDLDDVGHDFDPNPCPVICGDMDITGSEECEPMAGLDDACPGRCVPAGQTGSDGEPECTCNIGPCETANALPNASGQSFVDHYGWWTFTADAPAYAVEACGTQDYDSALVVYEGTCDNLTLAPGNHSAGIAYNDDCYGGPVFGDGSDPLASCYNDPVLVFVYPYNSCLCLPTNEGTDYWVFDPRVSFGDETILSLTKRAACDDASAFGACCDPFTGCQDVATAGDCDARGTFTDSKSCAGVGDQCPAPFLGACCDRLTGACSETTETACGGNSTYSLGTRCGQGVCQPDKGACCVQTPFDANCSVTKEVDCTGFFTGGLDCSQVECGPEVIPTVSEWGLVIMALLLLVGAKVYFGRREALA